MAEIRWGYCYNCGMWVGSSFPQLPNYWSNNKSAANHEKATSHKVKLMTYDEAFEKFGPK